MTDTSRTNVRVIFALTLVHFTEDFFSAFTTPLLLLFVEKLGLSLTQAGLIAGINRVTVYRILDALMDCGLVQRIIGGRAFFMESPPTPTTSPIPIFTANPAETWSALTRQALPSAPTAWKERFPGRFKISKCDSTVSARTASRLRNP